MAVRAAATLAYLLAGPLVESVFEPLIDPQAVPSGVLGNMIGFSAGRGIGLLFLMMDTVKIAVSVAR